LNVNKKGWACKKRLASESNLFVEFFLFRPQKNDLLRVDFTNEFTPCTNIDLHKLNGKIYYILF
jgi:hypothetical protein